jgi:hypothetical protein
MTDRPAQLTQLERLLARAQRRLHRARLVATIPRATEWALTGATAVALMFVTLRLVQLITAQPAAPRATGWTILLLCAAVIPFAATMLAAWRREPSWRETAERLDFAAADHNRVAIALALARAGDDSAFVKAAIADGLAWVERLQERTPYTEPFLPRWHRGGALAGFLVLLLIVGAWLPQTWSTLARPPGQPQAQRELAMVGTPHRTGAEQQRETPPSPPPAAPTPPPGVLAALNPLAAAATPQHLRSEPAGGRPGAGSTSSATAADPASATAGQASGANPKSTPAPQTARRPSASKKEAPPSPDKQGAAGQTEQSSSVAFGSSGRGAATPVQHDWSLQAQTTAPTDDEESEDEKVEDSPESSVQRGGVQPMLKDRNEAPSRDLGLAGDQGPPGAGRGGPTPPKKSRGTASLVLGVPVPDFVRGKLGPGTTKITHERVSPSAMPGEPATPVVAAPRSRPESPQSRFNAPAEFYGIVRAYLVALHSRDRQAPDRPPAADASPAQE